jgi:hypothetical protein
MSGHLARPVVVELAGPAGAGKTSTLAQLVRGAGSVEPLRITLDEYAAAAITLLPSLARLAIGPPRVGWKDMKRTVFLAAAASACARAKRRGGASAWVLDEGPVYMLARMRVLRGPDPEPPALRAVLQRLRARLARDLDLIVLLDAPDAVLTRRIESRRQPPPSPVQGPDLVAFLSRYRTIFDQVVAEFRAHAPVAVVRIDTGAASQDSVAQQIRGLLGTAAAAA